MFSYLGGKFMDGLGAVGNAIDVPGSMVRDTLAGKNPFDQLASPFSDHNRTSGRDLIRSYGLAGKENTWGNFAGGMATEFLTDPTNLIPGKSLLNTMKARSAAKAANTAADASNAVSMAQRAARYMPEEVAAKTAIKTEAGVPKRVYHGTNKIYDNYDPKFDSGENLYGKGYYTTNDPHIASEYAPKDGEMVVASNAKDVITNLLSKQGSAYSGSRHLNDALSYVSRAEDANPKILQNYLRKGKVHEDIVDSVAHESPMNVRMNYLDVRNPFNAEAMYPVDSLRSIKGKEKFKAGLQKKADMSREAVRDVLSNMKKDRAAGNPIDSLDRFDLIDNFLQRNVPKEVKGDDYLRYIERVTGDSNSVPKALKKLGHDGIVHGGGQRVGNVAHDVTIAFDPSQIHKPYIAKRIVPKQKLKSLAPSLSVLAANSPLSRKHPIRGLPSRSMAQNEYDDGGGE